MKIYALSLVLVASIAASAAAAPGAGWFNPAGYGGQLAQPTQTFTQPAYAQPVAYRGFYGMNRGAGYSGYTGGGCNNCGNHSHAGACWDCSNAWAGYCDEARGSCCGGIWDGFCGERHCNWCGHGGYRPRAHHDGHCGGHFGGWKRPARTCGPCDDGDGCDACDTGCGRRRCCLGHFRPFAWLGSACRKGWDNCNSCFAGLKGCFGGRCGGCDDCNSCGIGETSHIESAPITTDAEVVPAQPSSDAPAPGPAA